MTGRELAFDVLSGWSPRAGKATLRLEQTLARETLAPAERALATELVHGVIRRRETLSAILRPHVKRPLSQVEPGAHALLWIGAYQLVMLSGLPAYAVVNETAELAKRAGKPQWTGFVNGVLRSVARSVTNEIATGPGASAVPLGPGRFRVLDVPVFADPASDWRTWYCAAFSFPEWLVARWEERYDRDELEQLGFWFNSPAKLCLRVNTLKTTRDALLAAFENAHVAARPGNWPEAVWLEDSAFVPRLPGFDEGWFAVQDESAIAAGSLLAPRPGERVLDLCAAPGGKTTHLAALMQNQGQIVAADVDRERLRLVEQSCRRLGISIVETRLMPRDGADLPEGPFDRILVDVPCSNTGVLGKRPEVRWRLQPREIAELAALQVRLLRAACDRLAPGGSLVYSTCSIEPEENRAVVDAVLAARADVKLIREINHTPGRPADGGYQALLTSVRP